MDARHSTLRHRHGERQRPTGVELAECGRRHAEDLWTIDGR